MHLAALVFIDIAIIMVVARLFGRLALKIGQPPVVGEIVAGIALGPVLLGLLPGGLDTALFPPEVIPYLNILAQLGLVLFMFIVGLELDMVLIRGRERAAGTISAASVALPFALGAALSLVLHPTHDETDAGPVAPLALALFLGVAMSITAFPVLARILTDRGMHRTPIGVLALACAAVDDIIAWTLLAFVVAVVQGQGPTDVLRIIALTAAFAAFMFLVVRPALRRLNSWYHRVGRLTPDILSVVLVGVLVSSFVTEMIGIHAIFGAFLFGAAMPRENAADMTTEILERLEQVSVLLLLPLFFVVTGMRTDIGGITGTGWWQFVLILVVAIGGKFVGAFAAARALRIPTRQSTALALLMNTRGLTELVILNVGRDLGVLDDELYTLMVLMALVTTAMTGPLLRLVYSERVLQRDIAAAERASLGVVDATRVLVLLDDPGRARDLAHVAALSLGVGRPAQLVLSRLIVRADAPPLEVGAPLVPDLSRMATAVDELNAIARELQAQGVDCRVLCRFSGDPWHDLVAQAVASEASVVVVDDAWRGRPLSPDARTPFTLVTAAARARTAPDAGVQPEIVSVAAVVDTGSDGRAALVLACAAAARLRVPLRVHADGGRTARRISAALAPLREIGVDVDVTSSGGAALPTTTGPDGAGVALFVVTPGVDGSAGKVPRLRVQAGTDPPSGELVDELAEIVGRPSHRVL